MKWQELSIKVPREYVEPVSHLFSRYGYGLSTEKSGHNLVMLRTYLPTTSKRRLARIEVGINLVRLLQPMSELTKEVLESADWENSWKSHFHLLKIGERLVIKPPWIDYDLSTDDVVIELDPGMAFGTGYHPTTNTCLLALEALVRPGTHVLDLGTGSGILAIAAARLGASYVLAIDNDPTAVTEARKNFRTYRLLECLRLVRGTLPHQLATDASFDIAVANISAKAVSRSAPHILQALKPGGKLVASGFMKDRQGEVEEALSGLGFSKEETHSIEDWSTLVFSKTG